MTTVMLVQEKRWQLPHASFTKIVYNEAMLNREMFLETKNLVRSALLLWIGYFFALLLIDWRSFSTEPGLMSYYIVQILNGVGILAITLLPWPRLWSASAMLPITVVLMAIVPPVTVHVMIRLAPLGGTRGPLLSPDAMTLRLMPILLIGLLLTAWRYHWHQVILFCLGTTLFNLIWLLPGPFAATRHERALLVTVIELISLLMVGYFTSALVSRLRQQQRTLEEINARLRDQSNTQIELTISHERNRMARELHDTLAHTLSGLAVQLQTVKAYWEIEPSAAQEMLDQALAATRSGLQETRRALIALRAAPLENLGLALAVRQLAKSATEQANLTLQLAISEPLPALAPEVSQCLYRVAQEAIMNVVYHANAKTLAVTISVEGNGKGAGIELTIQDDGIGFDPNQAHPNHWGIAGMRERAQLVGGQLVLESQAERGTKIRLYIPEKQR